MSVSRRAFLESTLAAGGAAAMGGTAAGLGFDKAAKAPEPPFLISLAEWSFHRALFAKEMDHLDFAKVAKTQFEIDAIEYVNQFFKDKAKDQQYLAEMKKRADDHGVKSVLIMCDGEGNLGDPDDGLRAKAVENHHRWVEAAKFLGCHSIRVNARSEGNFEEQQKLAADGLRRLVEFGDKHDINVIVENHGGLSSNGKWLVGVMRLVDHRRCGTLPDFGNFRVSKGEEYDRYQGVAEMMPFAKGVSAKSYDFNDAGEETRIDYHRMMKIVHKAGYRGRVGIEYEGERLSEHDGVAATKKLLVKIRGELAGSG
jgi:sugar phosphate isomerase/epimerase